MNTSDCTTANNHAPLLPTNPYKRERDALINKIKNHINDRHGTSFTFEHVDIYIGSDMSLETLGEWTSDTISGIDPITPADISGLIE